MSTAGTIKIGTFYLADTYYAEDRWLFNKGDRVVVDSPRKYIYRAPLSTVLSRLSAEGYDYQTLELEFAKRIAYFHEVGKKFLDQIRSYINDPERTDIVIETLLHSTLEDWIQFLNAIYFDKFKDGRIAPDVTQDVANLYTFAKTTEFFGMNSDTYHGMAFPCVTDKCFVVALGGFLPEDTICELNVTEFVESGDSDIFEDVIAYGKGYTAHYDVFCTAMADIRSLISLASSNDTIRRMLFANVITAMETYVSDCLRENIIRRDGVKERFVRNHKDFKEKIALGEIYSEMKRMDQKISDAIEKTSFHNVDVIFESFKNILNIEIPKTYSSGLTVAVSKRHDIIHRNGKNFSGESINIELSEIEELIELVSKFIQELDAIVTNGLLDPITPFEEKKTKGK